MSVKKSRKQSKRFTAVDQFVIYDPKYNKIYTVAQLETKGAVLVHNATAHDINLQYKNGKTLSKKVNKLLSAEALYNVMLYGGFIQLGEI